MTQETDELSSFAEHARAAIPSISGGHNRLRAFLDILVAEHLLAKTEEPAPPTSWARVHMLGHQTHVGEVQQLRGGALLVHGIDAANGRGVYRYYFTAEQKGRHSIEWISEKEWSEHVELIKRDYAKALESRRRLADEAAAGVPPQGYRVSWEPDDADDPDGAGDWLWRHEASGEGGEESTQAEALAAAQQHADDTVPSDAAAGVPAAENIVRTLFLRRRHRGPDPPRAIRPVSSPRAEARPSPRLGPPQERCR